MEEKKKKIDKSASKKVANTMGTFLKKERDSFQIINVQMTQTSSEKVTDTVGTFLKKEYMSSRLSMSQRLKWHQKRLPIWWEPF